MEDRMCGLRGPGRPGLEPCSPTGLGTCPLLPKCHVWHCGSR